MARLLVVLGFAALVAPAACARGGKDAPPAPATLAVRVTSSVPAEAGTYDGAKALYLRYYELAMVIIPDAGCPAFDCDFVDAFGSATDKLAASCANAHWIAVTLTDGEHRTLALGATPGKIDIDHAGGSSLVSDFGGDSGLALTAIGSGGVSGAIHHPGARGLDGAFAARTCPPPS